MIFGTHVMAPGRVMFVYAAVISQLYVPGVNQWEISFKTETGKR
jgi:hypothetical protein